MNDDIKSEEIFGAKIAQFPGSVMEAQKALLAYVGTLADVQEQTLQHEYERKTNKYGQDSDEMKALEAQISADKIFHRQLRAQAQRAEATPLERREDRFTLHGRLIDSNDLGIPGLIVKSVDCHTQKALRHSSTDQRGYFKLTFHCIPEQFEKTEKISVERLSVEKKDVQFTLHVLNQAQAMLYRDDNIYSIVPGSVVYQEITIMDF